MVRSYGQRGRPRPMDRAARGCWPSADDGRPLDEGLQGGPVRQVRLHAYRAPQGRGDPQAFPRQSQELGAHPGGLPAKVQDKRIVDIGCGDGKLLWWLQSIGFKTAEGIAISEEQIRIAE